MSAKPIEWSWIPPRRRQKNRTFCRAVFVKVRISPEVSGDLQGRDDLDKDFLARAIYILIFFSFFFERIDTRQSESHRMPNTSTSRRTDFSRLKPTTSKTPFALYRSGFFTSDRTPTKFGFPAGPQSNQNVWVLPITVKSQIFVRYLISYFRTFEKSAKFNTGWKFIFVLRPSNFNVTLF